MKKSNGKKPTTPKVFVIPTFGFGKTGKIEHGFDFVMQIGEQFKSFKPRFILSSHRTRRCAKWGAKQKSRM